MARAALNWSKEQLAHKAKVGRNTIARFESGSDVRLSTVSRMAETYHSAGLEFDHDGSHGVRFKKTLIS